MRVFLATGGAHSWIWRSWNIDNREAKSAGSTPLILVEVVASRARGRFGRVGNRGGRGNNAARGGSGGGAQVIINNIDVTDPNRNFTAQEWEALGPNNGRAIVLQMRERANSRNNRDGRGRGRGRGRGGNERNIGAASVEEQARDEEGPPANNGNGDRGGRNGRGFGRGAYVGGRS